MKNSLFNFAVATLLTIIMSACNSDKGSTITADQVSPAETQIIRYDLGVGMPESRTQYLQNHPRLTSIVFRHIVGVEDGDSIVFRSGIDEFLDAEVTANIRGLIDSVYSDTRKIESDWKDAMSLYQHHFPGRSIPRLYTLQTNLALANFVFEDADNRDAVAASLDFFLGKAYPYTGLAQENPAFSQYNNRTFNKDHLVTKSVSAVLDDLVPQAAENNFLHHMIREGKKLLILEKLCPHLPDSSIYEFTPEQLVWCRDNEFEIWNFFLESDLIYETSIPKIRKYMEPAPTSQGMPASAPGRTAPYIGKSILEAYLSKKPGTDLKFLIDLTDAQLILNESKYKPRPK